MTTDQSARPSETRVHVIVHTRDAILEHTGSGELWDVDISGGMTVTVAVTTAPFENLITAAAGPLVVGEPHARHLDVVGEALSALQAQHAAGLLRETQHVVRVEQEEL